MRKYGVENFEIKPLAVCGNIHELNFIEEALIEKYKSIETGYNIRKGGDNHMHSDETKAKIGLKHKGKKLTDKHKQELRVLRTGTKLSDETKRRISQSGKGRVNSPESIEKQRKTILARRETLHNAKLTREKVSQIKKLFRSYSDSIIAEMFGVSRKHINDIRHGKKWGDIE